MTDYVTSSGTVLILNRNASPQFAAAAIMFRVIRAVQTPTNDDEWVWLDGYALDAAGDAIERRSVYVKIPGCVIVSQRQQALRRPDDRPTQPPAAARSLNPTSS